MRVIFTESGWKDYLWFQDKAGCWSGRITTEHRLVYEISDSGLVIISC